MRILDKYILKNFLIPFFLCFFGFLAIWLVFDLSDNASDFIEGKVGVRFVVDFYLTQVPQFIMIALPVGLLLSLLYCLSRMSRSNEVIAMLTAGQSLGRVLLPLFAVGLLLTGASMVVNYSLAPRAELLRKEFMDQIGKKREKKAWVIAHLFRNRAENRTWFIRRMPSKISNTAKLEDVHITQQNNAGQIETRWYAKEAFFNPETKEWTFHDGRKVTFDLKGNIVTSEPWEALTVSGWRETPWRIASSNLKADYLSVPELHDYLEYNADFPDVQLAPYRTHLFYRWALPWGCFVVVFLAAPLGIVYSRRGVLAGVAGAIFLFAGNTFFGFLMLAFGQGSRVSPFTAAWLPNILFLLIGLYCLYIRSSNREMNPLSWKSLP